MHIDLKNAHISAPWMAAGTAAHACILDFSVFLKYLLEDAGNLPQARIPVPVPANSAPSLRRVS